MKNCIIGQSGGPTVAINASLSGVLQEILQFHLYDKVYGMINGIEGLLQEQFMDLTACFHTSEALNRLACTPAMYLGSCRYKLPKDSEEVYTYLFNFFEAHQIQTVFYIGGNDSMDTVLKLSDYAKAHQKPVNIIGIPKTIDNDLPVTDHTPGFGSAAKFVATALLEMAHDTYIYHIPSITLVEIMGRNAGWLTAASILARTDYSPAPDLIYLPEVPFSTSAFIADIKRILKTRKNIVVALSEGIKDEKGQYISASGHAVDAFGHQQLCGAGKTLETLLKKELGIKVRSVELNILQRASGHIASRTDIEESIQIGKAAARLGVTNETAKMLCYHRTYPYHIDIKAHDVCEIANHEKTVPLEWITPSRNDLKQEAIDYLRPLILGEVHLDYVDGIPHYMSISHLHG